MRRRRVLATIGAFLLAGCGWQGGDEESSGNENGNSIAASDDENGAQDENGQQEPTSEEGSDGEDDEKGPSDGDGELIDRDAEELLLTEDDFASEEWVVQDAQRTGTCRVFERPYEDYALVVESCAEVFDDEETAVQEYQDAVDRSRNVVGEEIPSEQLDTEIDIGDEAVILGRVPDQTRVVFREANAYGTLDYEGEGLLNRENLPEESEIVALARSMYDQWRD
jgi:hypothetical protein